jgi:hypothetical protein
MLLSVHTSHLVSPLPLRERIDFVSGASLATRYKILVRGILNLDITPLPDFLTSRCSDKKILPSPSRGEESNDRWRIAHG